MNSSIQKYINITAQNDPIIPINPSDFKVLTKSPSNEPSLTLKKEAIEEEFQIKQENSNNKCVSAFSKASFESYLDEISFDHTSYLEIMHKLRKEPLKLFEIEEFAGRKLKSLQLIRRRIKKHQKIEISDFATKTTAIPKTSAKKKSYECKYCGASFVKPCALGGHMSKVHKGRSKHFKKRKEKREIRETERQRNAFFKTCFKQNL